MAFQGFREDIAHRDGPLCRIGLSFCYCALDALRVGYGSANMDQLLFKVYISVYVKIKGFASPESSEKHRHSTKAEVVFFVGVDDQLLFLFIQASVLTAGALRWFCHLSRASDN